MGNVKSDSITLSSTSNETPYINSFSRNTTGLGSRMADFKSPFASCALYGLNTFKPGTEPYQLAKHWECCAPTPDAAPLGPRNVILHLAMPPVIYLCLAAELTI
eukprot:NODE_893_length_3243_cov_0.465967.p4 type:complete len:104 gc:universal NODE_893_length_3243_cov_0.465967:2491-2180(-)